MPFTVDPSRHKEHHDLSTNPHTLVKQLSLNKAKDVAKRHKDSIIIAADTIVAINGKFLGKPKDAQDARRMLKILSGKTHSVITGLAIIDQATGKTISKSVESKVFVKKLTDEIIELYIKTGEPFDKAGAYGIQGKGSALIEKVEGDYDTVVGLPLSLVAKFLTNFNNSTV